MLRKNSLYAFVVAGLAVILVVGIYSVVQGRGGLLAGAELSSPKAPAQGAEIPAGAVMFFDTEHYADENDPDPCPEGWSELTAAQGFYIVGLPAGGDLGGIVGSALGNLEERFAGQHTHGVNDLPHTHEPIDRGHSHGWQLDSSTAGVSLALGDHKHSIPTCEEGGDGAYVESTNPGEGECRKDQFTWVETESVISNVRLNDPGHTHNFEIGLNTAGFSVKRSSTGITLQDAGTGVTNAPYIQLLVCRKD